MNYRGSASCEKSSLNDGRGCPGMISHLSRLRERSGSQARERFFAGKLAPKQPSPAAFAATSLRGRGGSVETPCFTEYEIASERSLSNSRTPSNSKKFRDGILIDVLCGKRFRRICTSDGRAIKATLTPDGVLPNRSGIQPARHQVASP